jgi:hypothetical protein
MLCISPHTAKHIFLLSYSFNLSVSAQLFCQFSANNIYAFYICPFISKYLSKRTLLRQITPKI